MKLVNGRDVAKAAGVSQSTVSRVMNADIRISSDTRRKVLAAARELGYDMRSAAGGWSVGVLIGYKPADANGYYTGIFSAVFQELERRGLRMEPIWRTLSTETEVRPIRGLLVLSHPSPEKLAAAYPLPVVWLNGPSNHLHNICSVNQDSYRGSEMAVRHLAQLGHRDIRYISLESIEQENCKVTETLAWIPECHAGTRLSRSRTAGNLFLQYRQSITGTNDGSDPAGCPAGMHRSDLR